MAALKSNVAYMQWTVIINTVDNHKLKVLILQQLIMQVKIKSQFRLGS